MINGKRSWKMWNRVFLMIVLSVCLGMPSANAETLKQIELVVDASRSMNEMLGQESKLSIAKTALLDVLGQITDGTLVGLRVFGHHRVMGGSKEVACQDTELMEPIQSMNQTTRVRMTKRIVDLTAHGPTPIGHSLRQAVQDFDQGAEVERIIILVSDGEETCGVDPVKVVEELKAKGINVVVHTIGFDVDPVARAQLQALAAAAGGSYYDAKESVSLRTALTQVAKQVAMVAPAKPEMMNVLAQKNGGYLIVSSRPIFSSVNDGVEKQYFDAKPGEEAVYAFKDDEPVTIRKVAVPIFETSDVNVQKFELLGSMTSPTKGFESIGEFMTTNAVFIGKTYQEFEFEPTQVKYLKIKFIRSWGQDWYSSRVYEVKVYGKWGAEEGAKEIAVVAAPTPFIEKAVNVLAAKNGGHLVVASRPIFSGVIDGKDNEYFDAKPGEEAVYAFKNDEAVTINKVAVPIFETSNVNLQKFELFGSMTSPTDGFESIGEFSTTNAVFIGKTYQEFEFEPTQVKYLKVKFHRSWGADWYSSRIYEVKVYGTWGTEEGAQEIAVVEAPQAVVKDAINVLAEKNGGHLVVASRAIFSNMIDGKDNEYFDAKPGEEAVYAFKDEKPVTISKVSVPIFETSDVNLQKFELLGSMTSPTDGFESIGEFSTTNVVFIGKTYQEFEFEPTQVKYLKVKFIRSWGQDWYSFRVYEMKLYGSESN